jgi:N-acetylglucosamine-6-sulfatase
MRSRTRRGLRLLAVGLVALVGVLTVWLGLAARNAQASSSLVNQPNVVVLLLDDLSPSQLRFLKGAPGDNTLRDRLRNLGMRRRIFKQAYCTTPLCCPARASLLRAQFAHNTGIKFNNPSAPGATDGGAYGFTQRALDGSTMATWLGSAGYRTALVGKYLNGYDIVQPPGYVPPSWSIWKGLYDLGQGGYWNYTLSENGVLTPYPHNTDADYSMDVLKTKATTFIASTPGTQPFFLMLTPTTPHAPAYPAPRHENLRPTLTCPHQPADPAYLETDVSDKCAFIQSITLPRPQSELDDEDLLYRNAANSLASVSEALVAILDTLDATGRLDQTLVLVMNDNGYSALEHRLRGKRSPFSSSVRTPLVALSKNPAWIGNNGQTQSLICNVDIAPTIAALTGVPIPGGHHVDGVSFLSILQSNANAPVRTDVLLENFGPEPQGDQDPPSNFPAWNGLVTGAGNLNPNWKYAEYDDGYRELYDLVNDPFELVNVVDSPDNAALVATLHTRLQQLVTQ